MNIINTSLNSILRRRSDRDPICRESSRTGDSFRGLDTSKFRFVFDLSLDFVEYTYEH